MTNVRNTTPTEASRRPGALPRLNGIRTAGFVAMTSELPYSPARTPDEAVEELRRCSGTQFDADVVQTLIAVRAEHAVELASVA